MTDPEPIAHLSEDGRLRYPYEHLGGTAKRAEEMASAFGCGQWGRVAGMWHDLGTYSD